MKKVLFAALALLFSMSIFAQGPRREFKPEEMATRQADHMKKGLDLNEKQYQEVYNLYLKRAEEMKTKFANRQEAPQMSREARREEMKKQQEAWDASMKQILNKKQYAKYQEMKQKEQERSKHGNPRGNHGGHRGF